MCDDCCVLLWCVMCDVVCEWFDVCIVQWLQGIGDLDVYVDVVVVKCMLVFFGCVMIFLWFDNWIIYCECLSVLFGFDYWIECIFW